MSDPVIDEIARISRETFLHELSPQATTEIRRILAAQHSSESKASGVHRTIWMDIDYRKAGASPETMDFIEVRDA